ncbi:MAG TPA: histidine phosphatase family protein [Trebonia sp.]|jgi:phosphohistidine phosphatase|nr:histidine phosphatase family protein [Trebonia sp.]
MTPEERRTLLLLRHAKSAWPDVPDHERPLARRGQRDARRMGRWLRAAGYVPDRVVCSTACRASQTWQLVLPALGSAPPAILDDRIYKATVAQLLDVIRRTSPPVRTLLVVGHAPALPELACTLAAAAPQAQASTGNRAVMAAADRMRAKFPTAAVAAFSFRGGWEQLAPGMARLACFVTPRELREK